MREIMDITVFVEIEENINQRSNKKHVNGSTSG